MNDTTMYQHFITEATTTVKQAINEDTAGNSSVAVGLYVSSTVLYMKALEYVQDEDFKKRVKVEVAKYLQRAQDLRAIEKQNSSSQQPSPQNTQQQHLQQVKQQQQTFRDQRQNLQEYLHAPPQPLPSSYSPSSTSQPLSPSQPHPLPPSQPHTPQPSQPGLLGSLLHKVKNAGTPAKPPASSQKKQTTKKPKKAKKSKKSKKGSDDDSDDEDDDSEEEEEEETSEEEEEDEEGDRRVEDLVREVEQEEGKGEEEENKAAPVITEQKKEKEKEAGVEYLNEIPDEQTLKTIDRMLLEEEKRVKAELQQTSVTDDKIADKIASVGMGLRLDEIGEDLDDDTFKDLILESRIAALGTGTKTTTTTKKSSKKKKPP